jgi:hypothetical protein
MKNAIFAVALLTVGCFSLPSFAQQQDLQEVMNAANALGARENELLSKKDAAGIASLFTSDALLVMLAPQFAFKPGRDAIQEWTSAACLRAWNVSRSSPVGGIHGEGKDARRRVKRNR